MNKKQIVSLIFTIFMLSIFIIVVPVPCIKHDNNDGTFPIIAEVNVYMPPTWVNIQTFLAQDTVNSNIYGPDYNCRNYADDLVEHAHQAGFNAWTVGIDFTHTAGHVIIAFITSDMGVMYVEAQTDGHYSIVKVGEPLCEDNQNWACMGNGENVRLIVIE